MLPIGAAMKKVRGSTQIDRSVYILDRDRDTCVLYLLLSSTVLLILWHAISLSLFERSVPLFVEELVEICGWRATLGHNATNLQQKCCVVSVSARLGYREDVQYLPRSGAARRSFGIVRPLPVERVDRVQSLP